MPIKLKGSSSGDITLDVPATAGTNTLTLPAVTDTLTGIAATQTLTNKTLTSPVISGPSISGDLNYTGTLTGSTGIINIGSGQIYKDASGNVGIGTTSPTSFSTYKYLHVQGSAVGTGGIFYTSTSDLSVTGQFYSATGQVSIGSNTSTPLVFSTAATERMRIDSSGNVGIGTSSPGAILHTIKTSAGAATVGAFIQNSDTTVGTEVRLGFAANINTVSDNRYGWIGYVNTGGTNGGALTFATTPGGTAATERMRIDSSGNLLFNSGYGSVATAYGCRAWVNFNGTGTVAIRGSGNVSSITDNGTGDYTMNFTTAMPDVNYAWSAGGSDTYNSFANNDSPTYKSNTSAQLTTSLRINTFFNLRPTGTQYSNGVGDMALITLQVFR